MTHSRTIRFFLSSTFRDFAEERDLLVRKVFPELRRKCRERQVELVDVDLRWGITEKEAQQGKVLPICLAEIERSRPYFIGFLGERYGWVPDRDQYDLSLLLEQPWLDEHRGGKSVTELEILHGVLNNPAMAGRALFYFRNPAYSRKKGGHYLSEGIGEGAKLEALKNRIRKSGFPLVENYRSPAALAARVREDLWKLIDEAFPEGEAPDGLARERMRHEAYGATRRRLYLGGERYFEALDASMKAKPFRPVLVLGESGGGKSALLANWVDAWRKRHPKASVIVHHLGCGADAADPVRMATRLMEEIGRATGDDFEAESEPDKLLEKLPEWLAIASAWAKRTKADFVIVLDGLDKIADRKHLRWFPSYLPPRVKLVASCLRGEVLEAAKKRLEWRELRVKPFTKTEQKRFIKEYLKRYRKSLTRQQIRILQSHPLSGNPLFLLTVLEELRVFGVHEALGSRLQTLLSPPPSKAQGEEPAVDDLFEHVLARLEGDLGKKLIKSAMEAVWASRAGLYQDEILSITNMAPAQWAAVQSALDEALYDNCGKINFGHDYLRKAVGDRYQIAGKRIFSLHRQLAEWFSQKQVDPRVAEELPWQWLRARRREELKTCLLDREVFQQECKRDGYELLGYWLQTESALEIAHEAQWSVWIAGMEERGVGLLARQLSRFLDTAGFFGEFTEYLFRRAAQASEKVLGPDHPETFWAWADVAGLLSQKGDHKTAEALYRDTFRRSEKIFGSDHSTTLGLLGQFAQFLAGKGAEAYASSGEMQRDFAAAQDLLRRVLEANERILGSTHPEYLRSANDLGVVLSARVRDIGHPNSAHYDATYAFSGEMERDLAAAEALYRRAVDGKEKLLGTGHPDTLRSVFNLGTLLASHGIGNRESAKVLLRRAMDGFERTLGADHRATLMCGMSLAYSLAAQGNHAAAECLFRRVAEANEKVLGGVHPETLVSIDNLGEFLFRTANYDTAEMFCRRVLEDREKLLGPDHAATIRSVANLGHLQLEKCDYAAAEALFRRVLESRARLLGCAHSMTLSIVDDLGLALQLKNDFVGRADLYRQVVSQCTIALGAHHPITLEKAARLGEVLGDQCEYAEAEVVLRRVLEKCNKILGAEHPQTWKVFSNLMNLLHEQLSNETRCPMKMKLHNACLTLFRHKAALSEHVEDVIRHAGGVLYVLACNECLEGSVSKAQDLIAKHLAVHPEMHDQALTDPDLAAIHDFIKAL